MFSSTTDTPAVLRTESAGYLERPLSHSHPATCYDLNSGIVLEVEERPARLLGTRTEAETLYIDYEGGISVVLVIESIGDLKLFKWRLANRSADRSAKITKFLVLRKQLPCLGASSPVLHGSKGGLDQPFYPPESWRQWSSCHPTEGLCGMPFSGGSRGGRSSNEYLPFFVLEEASLDERCWIMAMGWSGDWEFSLSRDAECAWFELGMKHLSCWLEPGESLLQPELLIGCYAGSPEGAQRYLRSTIQSHLQPSLADSRLKPFTFWDHYYGDRGQITEASFLQNIQYATELDLDYVILDGGWTGGGLDGKFNSLLPHIGNWRPDPDRFPEGLDRIAAAATQAGRKLGLWFDVEEAHESSIAFQRYPGLFFDERLPNGCHILRLDTVEGRDWAYQEIARNVAITGASWIRYDFNANPASSWASHDSVDRRGITECRYIENLYILFDDLRQRFPGLLIENCASGGRRIDLGTIRRTHADWFSDHTQSEAIIRYHIHGAARWLPSHRLNTTIAHCYLEKNRPVDWSSPLPASAYLSHFGGNFGMSDYPEHYGAAGRAEIRKFVNLFREISSCFAGDFYPIGRQIDLWKGGAGFAGIDPATGKAAAILFGSFHLGEERHELPSEIAALFNTPPCISDLGSDQFVASQVWKS